MKFRTDVTQGGYKILSFHGPDAFGEFAGVVKRGNFFVGVCWCKDGTIMDDTDRSYSLIPLAPTVVRSEWRNVYPRSIGEFGYETRGLADEGANVSGRIGVIRVDWLSDGTFKVEVEK